MHSEHGHGHSAEGKGQHNMLVVGQQTVFLSHLPMFNSFKVNREGKPIEEIVTPHRFQVLLEASFTASGSDPQRLYVEDRKKHSKTKIYTLEPHEFVLPELVSPTAPLRKLTGELFRGHLEKGGLPIASGIDVNVKTVIHFREFDPRAAPLKNLTYLLFGRGTELYLAHLITRPPDFDQIIAIRADRKFTEDDLRRGLQIVFPRENSLAKRLQEKQVATGEIPGIGKVKITVSTEFYLEEGELRVPADFSTTEAERKAGFS